MGAKVIKFGKFPSFLFGFCAICRNFATKIIWDNDIPMTLVSGSDFLRAFDKMWYSEKDCISVQTFPQDYDFKGQDVKYICGMSVPPVMMAQVARQIERQWLND